MSFKRTLIKFTAVLTLFFTAASLINVPFETQPVQAAQQEQTTKEKRQAIAKLAKSEVGKRYIWGATGPSAFDCSGLAQYVYKNAANTVLPRTTYQQVNLGKRVSLQHLKKGDLLFWGSLSAPYHVGIYVGKGKFVHAATPSQGVRKQTLSIYFYPSQAKRILN